MSDDTKKTFENFFNELKAGLKNTYENSKKYMEFLQSTAHFRRYSFNNMLYLYRQCNMKGCEGKYLNTFKGWRNLGFSVNKGEKAMEILIPSFEKYFRNEEGTWVALREATGNEKKKINSGELRIKEAVKYFFFKKALFDISQTNCPKEEYEKTMKENLIPKSLKESQDKKVDFLFLCLKDHLIQNEKANVVFEEMVEGEKGYTNAEGKIALNKNNSNLQNLKTIIHEYTHYKLHFKNDIQLKRYQAEIEAESVAYLVCRNFDIDTSDYSFKYINLYGSSNTDEELYKSYENINNAATDINKLLEEALREKMISELVPGDIVYANLKFSDNGEKARRLILITGKEDEKFKAFNITGENKQYVTSVLLQKDDGNNLMKDSTVKMDVKYLVDKKDIISRIGHIKDDDLTRIFKHQKVFEKEGLIKDFTSVTNSAINHEMKNQNELNLGRI